MDRDVTRQTGRVFSTAPIELVREGMDVIDAAGKKIGKVEALKMGDPEAATTQGEEVDTGGLIGNVARAFWPNETEPDVPEPLRAQLVRYGFIKVDGEGLFDTDRYVRADLIDGVTEDQVRLKVTKAQLPHED